jgi:FeS assembly SUF system protein
MDPNNKRWPLDTVEETAHHKPVNPPPATPPPAPVEGTPMPVPPEQLKEKIIEALHTCYDPEIPVNIYELGLIYDIDVSPAGAVHIRMTLTSPACPAAMSLPPEVQAKAAGIPGVTSAKVDVVWEPPWTQDRMSEAARLQLGLF